MKPINLTTLFTTPINNAAFTPQVGFKGSAAQLFPLGEAGGIQDTYTTNPLYEGISSEAEIKAIVRSNPRIMQLLKQYGIPLEVNVDELKALQRGHLMDTRVLAAKICSNMK